MAQVLVMHADDTIRLVLQQLLTEEGHEVCTVADGASAMRLLWSGQFDLAILGFVLHKPWKAHVYSFIRNEPTLKHLPVIWLQSSQNPQVEKDPAAPLVVINGPYDILQIVNAVGTLLPESVVA